MKELFGAPPVLAPTPAFDLATVGGVYSDGLTLIFDGESEATAKRYKCNTGCSFAAGQRVKICKVSGTYIVEYPVGVPGQ